MNLSLFVDELNRRETKPMTVKQISARLREIGYKLDRRMDCKCISRYMTGPHAGESYPCLTPGIKHIGSGLSFAHIDAPRDANFKELQHLRMSGEFYAVVMGYFLEI